MLDKRPINGRFSDPAEDVPNGYGWNPGARRHHQTSDHVLLSAFARYAPLPNGRSNSQMSRAACAIAGTADRSARGAAAAVARPVFDRRVWSGDNQPPWQLIPLATNPPGN